MANCAKISMDLYSWRGYSAYELAVQNGYEGTLEEWLQSLQGQDGKTTAVNGVEQQNGSIAITGAEIPVSGTDSRKISELAAPLDALAKALTITEDSVDLGGKDLDNALFR